MSILPELQNRIETLLSPFGGLEKALEVIPEKELERAALFYGMTLVLTPFQVLAAETEDLIPVPFVNLLELGYLPETTLYFLDSTLKELYRTIPGLYNEAYAIGINEEDLNFIESRRHGERLFINMLTNTGPKLLQAFICKTRHPEDIQRDIAFIERQKVTTVYTPNELIITLPNQGGTYRVYLYEAGVNPALTPEALRAKEGVIVLEKGALETVYITAKRPLWFMCENEGENPLEIQIEGQGDWRVKNFQFVYHLQVGWSAGVQSRMQNRQLIGTQLQQGTRPTERINLRGTVTLG